MKLKKGLFIAFEGIDGTGKSTHLSLLASYLRQQGHDVLETREPTDGAYGQRIRALYHCRQSISRQEELELFLLDRKEHVEHCIQPALAAGKTVLTDRYYFSTIAYQGAAGHDPAEILRRNAFAPQPDLVILLEVPVAESIRRIREQRQEQPNDFEQQALLEQVAAQFAALTQPFIQRIDAQSPRSRVQDAILQAVRACCLQKGLTCGD